MSGPISVAMKHMAAAGMSLEAIIAAVEEMESVTVTSPVTPERYETDEERRRRLNAERQRRYRERHTVTQSNADVDDSNAKASHRNAGALRSDPSPSDKKTPDPIKTQTPTKNPPSGVKKGSRLPDGWRPSAELWRWAKDDQRLPDPIIERETAKFCDYWRAASGSKGVKLDWGATWRNWIRSAAERVPDGQKLKPGGSAGAAPGNGVAAADETTEDGQRLLIEHFQKTGKWLGRKMARPDDPNTRLRPAVLREFGYGEPDLLAQGGRGA